MDNDTLVLFIVMLVINLVMAVALNLISRDVDDLHKFIMGFFRRHDKHRKRKIGNN